MKIPQKVKQVSEQLLNDNFLCLLNLVQLFTVLYWQHWRSQILSRPFGALLQASLPLMRNYFKDERIFWLSKPICIPKRESVLVAPISIRSDDRCSFSILVPCAQFPCAVSNANAVPTLLHHGTRARCWKIQASVRKELSRAADGTWTLAHLQQDHWGSTVIFCLWSTPRAPCSPGRWSAPRVTNICCQATPKDTLRLKSFKTFRALGKQYIAAFSYCKHAPLKGLLIPCTHIHVQDQKSISPHRTAAALVLPKGVHFAPILEICS